jgi:DNA-binding MarR family transcriptional regulator
LSSTSDSRDAITTGRPRKSAVTEPSNLQKIAQDWSEELHETDVYPFLITASIQRLSLYIERQFVEVARDYGLGAGDLRILLVLARSGPDYALRPTDLFRQLLITSGAVSKQVDRLVALRLVRRATHSSDVRIQMVCLEDRGHEIAREVMHTITTSFCGLEGLSRSQNAKVVSALELLLHTVESVLDENGGEG